MKIRTRLTIRYTAVTAAIFLLSMLFVYLFSEHSRSQTFFRYLQREAVTKAHLFLKNKVDATVLQSIYLNNRAFIDEVEVAIYTPGFEMLYHDASQFDIIKENREMIEKIKEKKIFEFYEGHYQAVGMLYHFNGKEYIITAAAYDGYGYANLRELERILIAISLIALSILIIAGYLLARSALNPVAAIVKEVENITASHIDKRLPGSDEKDELGELSAAFNDLLERLEKAFRSQKMFVSNVSHELRTPMAALITELEIVRLRDRSPERYREAIDNALNDAKGLIRLIEGLLNLARADYQPDQIRMTEIRLDEVLLDARSMVMKANPDFNVSLIFEQESEDDSVLTVEGNQYLLFTAFINLMENNCKYSPDHTSCIHISYWERHSILRFSDNGVGMSAADKDNLFTPFYRGENREYAKGHGIGMTLAKKIIELHNGELEVFSYPGEGTTFIVKLLHIPT